MVAIKSIFNLYIISTIFLVDSYVEASFDSVDEKLKSFIYSKKKNYVLTKLKFDFDETENKSINDMDSYNPKPKSERIPVMNRYSNFESSSYFKDLIDQSIKINHHDYKDYSFFLDGQTVTCKLPHKSQIDQDDNKYDFLYYNPSMKYLKQIYMFVLMDEVSKLCFSTGLPLFYIKICPLNSVHKQLAEYKKHSNGTEYIEFTNLGNKKNFTLEDEESNSNSYNNIYTESGEVNIRELLKKDYYNSSLAEYDNIYSKKYITIQGRLAKLYNLELKDIANNETEIVINYTLNEIINHMKSNRDVGVFVDSVVSRNDHVILSSYLKNLYGEEVVKSYFEPRYLNNVSRESLIKASNETWESNLANIIIPVSRRIIKVVSGNLIVLNREFITENLSTDEFEIKMTNQKSRSSGMIEIINYISVSRNIVYCKGCNFYFNYAAGDYLLIVSENL